jgi:peroxiredoxin
MRRPAGILRRGFLRFLTGLGIPGVLSAIKRPAAPDFELPDAKGKKRKLSEFRGKVVLLNFWATWCPPCRAEMPELNRLHHEYADRGFTVLGVAMDERGWRAVTPFLSTHRIDYPVLLGNAGVANDYGGVRTIPHTLFLDREGRVVATYGAALDLPAFRKSIEAMLAEAPPER